MPPTKPKTIAISVDGTTVKNNNPVYVLNRNTGDRWMQLFLAEKNSVNALVSLTNENLAGDVATAWEPGHVVEITVIGIVYGTSLLTLDEGKDQEVIVTTDTDDGPALTI